MKKIILYLFAIALFLGTMSCATENGDPVTQTTESVAVGIPSTDVSEPLPSGDAAGDAVSMTGSVSYIRLGSTIETEGPGVTVNGNIIYIAAAGNYSVSGTLADGQIVANCKGGVIYLELAGADITNSTGPAIYSPDAEDLILLLKEDTVNRVADGQTYKDAEMKGTIFCEDDLTIRGNGTLLVTGNNRHGIAGDDSMRIEGGNITVLSAVTDALHANDDITITGGKLSLTADSDGIESELTVHIAGGILTIDALDDAIHAETDLIIDGGVIDVVRSYEGLEGKNQILINDGNIRLLCDDDAINAGVYAEINGGTIYADCNGDGLDSNGNLTINGGLIVVFAGNNANGPIDIGDRGASFVINGGTVLATGGNMGISVSNSSLQRSLWIGSRLNANTLLHIADADGKEILSCLLPKSSSLLFFSSGEFQANADYTITTGGSHSGTLTDGIYLDGVHSGGTVLGSVTMSSVSATLGQAGGGMGGWGDFDPGEGDRRPGRPGARMAATASAT